MSCNCTTPCTSTCPSYCGCTVQVPGTCVFYQGPYISCLDATKGDTYDSIITKINDIVCDLLPPSGTPSYVGTPGEIIISGNVIGLDSAILNAISTSQTNIANLQNCVQTNVRNITSSSLAITATSVGVCGKTLNIEYTPPAIPLTQKQGIIQNVTAPTTILNGFGYSYDFSSYGLVAGDVIKFKGTLIRPGSGTLGEQTYIITDTIVNNTMTSFANKNATPTSLVYTLDDFEIILSVVSVTPTILTVKTYAVFDTLTSKTATGPAFVNSFAGSKKVYQFATTLALDITNVRFVFTHPTTDPTQQQYFVQLIRKI